MRHPDPDPDPVLAGDGASRAGGPPTPGSAGCAGATRAAAGRRPLVRPADRGLLFDELEPGGFVESERRAVTESDVAAFAAVSGDFNPLHLDEEFARTTTFRRRIAHGLLVESIASGLAYRTGIFDRTLVAIQEMRLRYVAPVGLGDVVRTVLEVLEREAEPGPRRGWVRFRADVLGEEEALVIRGEWTTLMHRRLPAARRKDGPR